MNRIQKRLEKIFTQNALEFLSEFYKVAMTIGKVFLFGFLCFICVPLILILILGLLYQLTSYIPINDFMKDAFVPWFDRLSATIQPFWAGFAASATAAAAITIAVRERLSTLIGRMGVLNKEVFFRLPTMTAVVPIMRGIADEKWRKKSFIVRLDWTYSGNTALSHLGDESQQQFEENEDRINILVSTGYALAKKLADNHNLRGDIWYLPFAIVTDPIYEVTNIAEETNQPKSYCYSENSIQEDYLRFYKSVPQADFAKYEKIKTTGQAMDRMLRSKYATNRYLVWEPYDLSHRNINSAHTRIEHFPVGQKVVLCLVHKIVDDEKIKKSLKTIGSVLRACCEKNMPTKRAELEDLIRDYFPEDALGIEFQPDYTGSPGASYEFGFTPACNALRERIDGFQERNTDDSSPVIGQWLDGELRREGNEIWPGFYLKGQKVIGK